MGGSRTRSPKSAPIRGTLRKRSLRLRALVVAALALTLPGCLDITEEIRVNGNGSGRIRLEVAVAEEIPALAALAGEGAPGATPIDEARLRAALDASDNIESFTIVTRQGDGKVHTVIDAAVRDFTRPLPDLGGAGRAALPMDLRLECERLPNRNLRLVQPLAVPEFEGGAIGRKAAELLAGMALADRFLTVRIHGRIASANGIVSEDRRSVEWRIPIAQILSGTVAIAQLEAEIAPPPVTGLTVTVIVLLIVAVLAIASVVLFRRRLLSS